MVNREIGLPPNVAALDKAIMTLGQRIEERRLAVGISQAELARRVGVRQSTMNSLIKGDSRSSRSIVQIARELGTTPAYLMGDTNDADLNAVPAPPPTPPIIMMSVNLPPERALVQMFQGLLATIDPNAPRDEQALLLAQRLPIGLSQLRDLLPDFVTATPHRPERPAADATHAMPHPEPTQ